MLDNHDDFGGHAKRNEFTSAGRVIVGYGGTQAIEGRLTWSPVAKGLRDELGIDTARFFTAFDAKRYTSLGLGQGVFFDKETWTVDRLVKGGQGNAAEGPEPPQGWWRQFAASAPFSDAARRDFVRIHEDTHRLPAGSLARREAGAVEETELSAISARPREGRRASRPYFQQRTHSGWGVGIDAIPAIGATWLAGFQGMGFPPPRETGRSVHLPFPRRQRLDRAAARSGDDPGGRAGNDDGGCRHRASFNYAKLDEARARCACA